MLLIELNKLEDTICCSISGMKDLDLALWVEKLPKLAIALPTSRIMSYSEKMMNSHELFIIRCRFSREGIGY